MPEDDSDAAARDEWHAATRTTPAGRLPRLLLIAGILFLVLVQAWITWTILDRHILNPPTKMCITAPCGN